MTQTTKTSARKGTVTQRPTASADRPGDIEAGAAMREVVTYATPETPQTTALAGLFTNGATLH